MSLSHGATGRKLSSSSPQPSLFIITIKMHQIANELFFLYRPMKKKGGGTLAGIPRASGERNSPTNGAFPNNQVCCISAALAPLCISFHFRSSGDGTEMDFNPSMNLSISLWPPKMQTPGLQSLHSAFAEHRPSPKSPTS